MWYVIWAASRKEKELYKRIIDKLPRNLYREAWIPMRKELRIYHGEEVVVPVKLFPGYVFIDTDNPEAVEDELHRDKDFIRFLGDGETYTPVSAHEEEIIRHFTGLDGVADISIGVITNGRLTVLDGPLKGMEDKIIKIDRHRRKARVRIEALLGEDRELVFALNVVEKN